MKAEYSRYASGRIFQNELLEGWSKVHPATPFLFYVPLITLLEGYALYRGITTWGQTAVAAPLGLLAWCFMEYALHRAFLHWEGSGPWTRRLHDVVHGYHHRYPDDPERLVMPLGGSIPLGILVSAILWAFGRPSFTIPFFVGIVAGYLVYDFTHWSVHYRTPKTAFGRALRAHHMAHHFADPSKNFGISHRWLDVLMGTMRRRA